MTRLLFLTTALLLAGCGNISLYPGLYYPPIEQGNLYERETIEKLEIGMNKDQVRFLLGSPVTRTPFRSSRWDYIYRLKRSNGTLEEHHMVLWFENEELAFFEEIVPLEEE